jgi:hypothetical protein
MAGIERTVPKEARLLVRGGVFVFRYLLNRPVIWISEIDPEELNSRRPTYLVLPALMNSMSPEGRLWIERNCRLVGEFGRHSIYEVLSPLPQDPGILGGRLRTDRSSLSSEGPGAANVSPR